MFGNFVNRHDARRVADKLGARDLERLFELARPGSRQRVERQWSHTSSAPTHWWDIPGMTGRWNQKVTGNADLDARTWFLDTYLPKQDGLKGLSIGCGVGARELEWAATGRFSHLDGIDLSQPRIDHANQVAADKGLGDVLNFEVADLMAFGDVGTYDVVIGEQSLHHFAPMNEVLDRLSALLKPGGYVFLDEFVGPTRFQWSDQQLDAANELLGLLPNDRRVRHHDGRLKARVIRPSLLAMRLKDPSEAIESARILPELAKTFEVETVRGYGGTVLHITMPAIAQHFLGDDDATLDLVDFMFEFEDQVIEHRDLGHDFVVAVARKAG